MFGKVYIRIWQVIGVNDYICIVNIPDFQCCWKVKTGIWEIKKVQAAIIFWCLVGDVQGIIFSKIISEQFASS